ncbi:MAG: SDR family oxidoreductase [Flavobacteriales bacterium]|nr:SDR family oxidoreductase [Flavobacteriales bacterium]
MKTIVVTGAARGVGSSLVKQFAAHSDYRVIAISRDEVQLKHLRQECIDEYGNTIHTYAVDFLKPNYIKDIEVVFGNHPGHIDILVNNAGLLVNAPFQETSPDQFEKIFRVNFEAPVAMIRQVVSHALPEKAVHVVNVGSMGGFQGSVKFPGLSAYSSSKAALANLTECLAEEYKSTNIKFNCLALGSVQTDMLEQAFPGYQAQLSPDHAAVYMAEFALEGWRYFNGKIIPVSKETP